MPDPGPNGTDALPPRAHGWHAARIFPWIIALALLSAGSLWLRIEHVNGTIPYVHHIDELQISVQAVHMLKTGDPKPKDMKYPSLPKYLATAGMYLGYVYQAGDFALKHVEGIGNVGFPYYDSPGVMRVARYLFVLLSIGTLIAVGITAWLLLQRPSALLLAPLLLATAPSFLVLAVKYLNVDNAGTCFVMASIAALLYGTRRRSTLFLAAVPGLFAGLAAGSKYTHGLVLGPILIGILFYAGSPRRVMIGACLAAAAAFFVVVPYSVLDVPSFIKALAWQAKTYGTGWHGGAEAAPGLEQLVRYSKHFVTQFGSGGLLLAGIGLIACAHRDWRRTLVFLSFPAVFVLLFVVQRVHFTRNMLPVVPFLAVLAVAGLYVLHGWIARAITRIEYPSTQLRRLVTVAAWPVLVAAFLTVPIENVSKRHLRISSDSRHEAVAWISANVPIGSTIVVPNRLGLDTRPLENRGYSVRGLDFVPLDSKESLQRTLDRVPGASVVLSPVWGIDPRFEGKELADRLNTAADWLEPSATFGKRPVMVNYRYPVMEPNPRFDIAIREALDGH